MGLDGAVLGVLLQVCAPSVAPETMVAIIRVESQGDPFRIGVNSGALCAASLTMRPTRSRQRGASFNVELISTPDSCRSTARISRASA